jgi:hypothetical protein
VPLAFHLTKASSGDAPELLPLVDQLAEHRLAVAERRKEPGAEYAALRIPRFVTARHRVRPW